MPVQTRSGGKRKRGESNSEQAGPYKCPFLVKELRALCKHEEISCAGNKEELCKRLVEHISALDKKTRNGQKASVYAPEKYFAGLTPKERAKRLQEIRKGAKTASDDPDAYEPFKTDFDPQTGKRRKTKQSKYTKAFSEMHPGKTSLAEKAEATGVPIDILQQVYDRGLAAWRTGHRPGATQGQWGSARVNSFLTKGCTYYFPDHLLVAEAKKKSKKAKKHWENIDCICKKGCRSGKK